MEKKQTGQGKRTEIVNGILGIGGDGRAIGGSRCRNFLRHDSMMGSMLSAPILEMMSATPSSQGLGSLDEAPPPTLRDLSPTLESLNLEGGGLSSSSHPLG
ncbi:hypothetical protein CDL15_Pgr004780 [Punica granatum]|uniref:Uncharacterized protein n=1 Tax=Punica granatum TaxID=22663 RepID=A0A218W741_PUNGR|nr:hypothetical protein CDL15_Pgr004780 [Punica granatum]